MIILHAAWLEGQLFVWGESPLVDESKLPSVRGAVPVIPKAKPFPYDTGPEELLRSLESLGFPVEVKLYSSGMNSGLFVSKTGYSIRSNFRGQIGGVYLESKRDVLNV